MKHLFLIFIAFTFFACVPVKKEAENNSSIKSEKIPGTTKITFNEDIHDLGVLESGEIVLSTFVFTNIGEHNFIINRIEPGCGCIQVNFSETPINPGEEGTIEIQFDSSGMFGKQFKSIEIHANFKEPKHLAIFATVKNENLEIIY
jgi:hypothetical protein